MTDVLHVHEVASRLGVTGATVRRWINDGKLRAIRPGNRMLLVPRVEFQRFLEAANDDQAPPPAAA